MPAHPDQLHLFGPAARPNWWTEHDTAAVESWLEISVGQGGGRAADPRLSAQWVCRRCARWESRDGKHGRCLAPEPGGWTGAGFTCPAWEPRS